MINGTIRVKTAMWLATAVVLSVFFTLLVSQQWQAQAAQDDTDSTYVPIANCRLFDFRGGTFNIGPKSTPLEAGESNVYTQSVHGINGDCEIPSDAVGVAMNVTVANPTAQSNLRVFPADIDTPNASNLNWLAGQSPTPNMVDVKLSSDGNIKLFNFRGSVDVLADVVGYYTSSTLQEIEQRLVALENGKPFAVTARGSAQNVTFESATIVSLDVTAPADGQITVNSAAYVSAFSGSEVQCSIVSTNADPPEQDSDYLQVWDSPSAGQHRSQISGTRLFTVSSGEVLPLKLVCGRIGAGGTMQVSDAVLTAIFTPAP